jgi:hypothetical protein
MPNMSAVSTNTEMNPVFDDGYFISRLFWNRLVLFKGLGFETTE